VQSTFSLLRVSEQQRSGQRASAIDDPLDLIVATRVPTLGAVPGNESKICSNEIQIPRNKNQIGRNENQIAFRVAD